MCSMIVTDPQLEYQALITDISKIYEDAKDSSLIAINKIKNRAYWLIGERIVQLEQNGETRAQYGARLIDNLSEELSKKHANGFSVSNLRMMRKFYLTHPNQQPNADLSWSHHQLLLTIKDESLRQRFEKQTLEHKWSKRELKRVLRDQSVELYNDDSKRKQELLKKLNKNSSETLSCRYGEPYFYVIRTLKNINGAEIRVVDCGFGIYKQLSEKDARYLRDGDIVRVNPADERVQPVKHDLHQEHLYTYKAGIKQILSAGEMVVNLDCGFGQWHCQPIKLRHIFFPSARNRRGVKCRQFVEGLLKDVDFIVVRTYPSKEEPVCPADVFYLPDMEDVQRVAESGKFLNQVLIDEKIATRSN